MYGYQKEKSSILYILYMYEKSEYILFIWYLCYNEKSKIFTYLVYVLFNWKCLRIVFTASFQ